MINVGDRVKRISGRNHGMEVGDTDIVESVGETAVTLENFGEGHAKNKLEVISRAVNKSGCSAPESRSMLKTISLKLRAALGDKIANQVIAGLRNDDLSLTCKGKDIAIEAYADGVPGEEALIKAADEIIAEDKKRKEKN